MDRTVLKLFYEGQLLLFRSFYKSKEDAIENLKEFLCIFTLPPQEICRRFGTVRIALHYCTWAMYHRKRPN